MPKPAPAATLAENRRARFDHEILETFEAGLELSGPEVKSVRAGRLVLAGSHAILRGGQAWLMNAQIPPYQPKNVSEDLAPDRTRRLLLHRSEIASLVGRLEEKGLSLIPLRAYASHGLVKIELGLARSRKTKDKREFVKKRETEREMRRAAG